MTAVEFFFNIKNLSTEQQEKLYKKMESICTDEEIKALKVGVAYLRMLSDPKLKEAMMEAMANDLYARFQCKQRYKE